MARDCPKIRYGKVRPRNRMHYLRFHACTGRYDPLIDLRQRREQFDAYKKFLIPVFRTRCYVCGRRGEQWHHIVFVSRGGADSKFNLVPLCKSCHKNVHRHNTGSHRPKVKEHVSPFVKPTVLVVYVPPEKPSGII